VSDRALVVFVKAPRPGAVKTRLVPALGPDGAAAVYRAMARGVLAATTPRPGEYERLVFFDPEDAAEEMRAWLPGLRLIPQSGPDLGARMSHALSLALRRGAGAAAVIGTDAPGIDRGRIVEALAALESHDVVLGPAADGGYYLLALSRPHPELFSGISWSTPGVLAETQARAADAGLRVHLLPDLRDVDTADDLRVEWPRVRALLEDEPGLASRVAAALELPPR